MTEAEWLLAMPSVMMHHINQMSPASVRRLRLLAVAYGQYLESQPDYADAKHASYLGDEVIEGRNTLDQLWDQRERGWGLDGDWSIANMVLAPDEAIDMAVRTGVWLSEDRGRKAGLDVSSRPVIARSLILCVLGNPFRPVTADSRWLTSTAVALAQTIYADRAFDRLPILADALEEAGCDIPDVLNHLRGGGPHARGCWVVDLVLGKE